MAKPEKSLEDLDAELARLEAELASLENGDVPASPAKKPKPEAKKPKATFRFGKGKEASPEAAEAPEPASPEPSAAKAPDPDAPPAPTKKGVLGRFRKRAAAEPAFDAVTPEPEAVEAEPSGPAPKEEAVAADAVAVTLPAPDASGRWSRESGGWRRTADAPRVVYRRVLDAEGNVVEETRADEDDLREAAPETPRTERKRFNFLTKLKKG